MTITAIRIRRTYPDEPRMKAIVSITLDGELALHDIKVIEGDERLFIAMPSRKDENGVFRDIAHPITPEFRKILEDAVIEKYNEYIMFLKEMSGMDPEQETRELEQDTQDTVLIEEDSTMFMGYSHG